MNLFYTRGAILGPFVAGAIYDQTQSYALVFTGITISLLISTAMTALLVKPWARVGTRIDSLSQQLRPNPALCTLPSDPALSLILGLTS
jgi:hypothetical protein